MVGFTKVVLDLPRLVRAEAGALPVSKAVLQVGPALWRKGLDKPGALWAMFAPRREMTYGSVTVRGNLRCGNTVRWQELEQYCCRLSFR